MNGPLGELIGRAWVKLLPAVMEAYPLGRYLYAPVDTQPTRDTEVNT